MKKIVIRNLSDVADSFACFLVFQVIEGKKEIFGYKDVRIERILETDEQVEFKLININ